MQIMKKRFYETNAMYERRCDVNAAYAQIRSKKLWRIDAIEMKRVGNAWQMGRQDHFSVNACSAEMAIGVFKLREDRMNWFVVSVKEESVVA